MKLGELIEYIEQRKIVCAVILKVDGTKLKVLTENGREIKLSIDRICNISKTRLDLAAGKTQLVESVKQISLNRQTIADSINVESLWKERSKKPNWIEAKLMTKFCFPNNPTEHEKAAVIRAFFNDNLYFKFKPIQFFPNSKNKLYELKVAANQIQHDKNLVKIGVDWIKSVIESSTNKCLTSKQMTITDILSSYYILGKTSPHYNLAKTILAKTNINSKEELFNFMVKISVWDIDENIDILKFRTPVKFSYQVLKKATELENNLSSKINIPNRVDFTHKFTITIDGPDTLDFDDALSIEKENNNYTIGIHISDVAHFIKKEDAIDKAARKRISSIYMPDMNIPMIPSSISENICSLKQGQIRPAISTIVKLNSHGTILDYHIIPTTIKVDKQLTYSTSDKAINHYEMLTTLYKMAQKRREIRIKNGATQITIPTINICLEKSTITKSIVEKINRESPSRILVAEMMILANSLIAQFLKNHKIPAIFRSQPEPRIKLTKKEPKSLFHNWMQKKVLKKLSLKHYAERHCILGLDAYVTATSPIRKYSDLVTQRQIHNAIDIDQGYTKKEITIIIQELINNTPNISKIQNSRSKYWLLKHLENKVGKKEKAIVLQKNRDSYSILIKTYMLECTMPQSRGIGLKPRDIVQVGIQHVSARNGVISVYMI